MRPELQSRLLAPLLCVLFLFVAGACAFGVDHTKRCESSVSGIGVDRSRFLAIIATGGAALVPSGAFAKDGSTKAGTKLDPDYETCMSGCLYECTKPKGAEQKSRAECRSECKEKCATSKAQMMVGTPKAN